MAPITDATNRRKVYLPRGIWTDWWTGNRTAGPCWLDVEAGIETLPLYLREGAVVAMGPAMNHVGEKPVDRLTLRVAPFVTEGVTRVCVPVNGRRVAIVYEAADGAHTVRTHGCPVPVEIEPLGVGRAVGPEIVVKAS